MRWIENVSQMRVQAKRKYTEDHGSEKMHEFKNDDNDYPGTHDVCFGHGHQCAEHQIILAFESAKHVRYRYEAEIQRDDKVDPTGNKHQSPHN
jgi:hypothetical protein